MYIIFILNIWISSLLYNVKSQNKMIFITTICMPVILQKRSGIRLCSELYIREHRYIGYELMINHTR